MSTTAHIPRSAGTTLSVASTPPQRTLMYAGSSPPRTLYAVPERKVPRAGHVPLGRTLHLVDLENLMGGPFADMAAMSDAFDQYKEAAWVQEDDHVLVAVNPGLMVEAAMSCKGCRLLVGGGRDGADRALIREVRDAVWIASLYDRIVIGSGDGIFEIVAAAFTALGLPVGVVARPRSLAQLLAKAASFVQYIATAPALGGAA